LVSSADVDEENLPVLREALVEAFGSIPTDSLVVLRDFARYQYEHANPFVKLSERRRSSPVERAVWDWVVETPESHEDEWEKLLLEFIFSRLLPLGGATIGYASDGAVCLGMTSAGRYLLGLQSDFEYEALPEGGVVVQPNFDVVFVAPAPAAEAEIGRLAERVGTGVGTLFRITQRSIYAAASAGMRSESAIAALRAASSKDLPANVEREIVGWFERCRRVLVRPATIARCPDAETAARVCAALGEDAAQPITETVLELRGGKIAAKTIDKLRRQGVFIDEERQRSR
jgi:hypothetical protein